MRSTAGGVVLVLVGVVALVAGINGTYGKVWDALTGIQTVGSTVTKEPLPTKPKTTQTSPQILDVRQFPGAPGSGVQLA